MVELGGGTGSITMGLIERGIPRDRLVVIELDGPMHAYLKERLPGVQCHPGRRHPAGRDPGAPRGRCRYRTVISGIPMVGNPIALRRAIVGQGVQGRAARRLHAAVQLLAGGPDPGQGLRGQRPSSPATCCGTSRRPRSGSTRSCRSRRSCRGASLDRRLGQIGQAGGIANDQVAVHSRHHTLGYPAAQ